MLEAIGYIPLICVSKGPFTRRNLYHTILLYYYAETKAIIYELANLTGVVYNLLYRVNWPYEPHD